MIAAGASQLPISPARSERPAAVAWQAAVDEAVVVAPDAPGGHEREDEERDPLVRLLPHEARAREVDELQEELLAETEERRPAAGDAEDQRQAGSQLERRGDPLEQPPLVEHDVVDERLEQQQVGAVAAAPVDLEVQDRARLGAVDERRLVRAG